MTIKTRHKDDITILDLEGTIDINAADFVEKVGEILHSYQDDIICNFAGVNLVDYVGVSIIAIIYKNVINHNRKIEVCNVPVHIQNLFAIVGLHKVFTYYPTEEAAIRGIQNEKKIYSLITAHLRRRFRRAHLTIPFNFKQKFVSSEQLYEGKIVDLSAVGIFVTTEKMFSIGDLLELHIPFSQKTPSLTVDAKVVWLADKSIQPQALSGMGLEFHDLTSEKQKQIIEFVEKHLASSHFD
ncbi:MAG: PilZ domain-containing protein [Candidatus Omnitrophica bacterium]|nr:PilZ domain-containing protein [Candidatus Omnitrophota bacterium]